MHWVWFAIWIIVGIVGGVGFLGHSIWAALQILMWLLFRLLVRKRTPLREWISKSSFNEWWEERAYYRLDQRILLWSASWVLWVAIGVWIWF